MQIDAVSTTLERLYQRVSRAPKPLKKLHLPVGGRRFRPTLEDVIEFLVVEKLARPRDGWDKVIEQHRTRWLRRQLRAAVRRDPEPAAEELRDLRYVVSRDG